MFMLLAGSELSMFRGQDAGPQLFEVEEFVQKSSNSISSPASRDHFKDQHGSDFRLNYWILKILYKNEDSHVHWSTGEHCEHSG